jgi:deoxyhypusine synthase
MLKKMKKNKYLKGKMIEPLQLEGNEKVSDFIKNVFANSGYNARRLAEACSIFSRMIKDDTTICLTLAGAMTPIGMSGPIIKMMELGFIDFIISTGANLYHDMHRAYDMLMVQGEVMVDDKALNKCGIARIYDVFIQDSETLFPTDECILNAVEGLNLKEPISTAQLHKIIGDKVLKTASHPEKSILAMGAKYKVPIYTPSPGDSSIGMNIALPRLFGHKLMIDPILDVIETTAIVRAAKKNGVVICGGGAPKNFYLQTQPTLWQIFRDVSKGGHDYFIQLTTDSPQWGGLSGATPQEAVSWGKVKNPEKNSVVVYSCASITLPLLFQYVKITQKPRKRKELLNKVKTFTQKLFKTARSNKKLIEDIKKSTIPQNYKRIYEKILGPK